MGRFFHEVGIKKKHSKIESPKDSNTLFCQLGMDDLTLDVAKDKIVALQQQLEFYQGELDVARASLQAAKSLTVEKMVLLEAANKRVELLSKEKDASLAENKRLFHRMEQNLQNYFKRIAQYEGHKIPHKIQIEKADVAVETQNDSIATLNNQIVELQKDNEALTKSLIAAKKEKLELKVKFEEMNHFQLEQIENLQSEIAALKEKIATECFEDPFMEDPDSFQAFCSETTTIPTEIQFQHLIQEYTSLSSKKRSLESMEEQVPSTTTPNDISASSNAAPLKRRKAFVVSNQRALDPTDTDSIQNNHINMIQNNAAALQSQLIYAQQQSEDTKQKLETLKRVVG